MRFLNFSYSKIEKRKKKLNDKKIFKSDFKKKKIDNIVLKFVKNKLTNEEKQIFF